jgi:hypothetical protein
MPCDRSERYWLVGAIVALTIIEVCRNVPILVGLKRQRFFYGRQDLMSTIIMLVMVALWEWARWLFGFGTSFGSLPIENFIGAVQ